MTAEEVLQQVAIALVKGHGYNDLAIVPWPCTPERGYRLELRHGPCTYTEARTTLLAAYAGPASSEEP